MITSAASFELELKKMNIIIECETQELIEILKEHQAGNEVLSKLLQILSKASKNYGSNATERE